MGGFSPTGLRRPYTLYHKTIYIVKKLQMAMYGRFHYGNKRQQPIRKIVNISFVHSFFCEHKRIDRDVL